MMKLAEYLKIGTKVAQRAEQKLWFARLEKKVRRGLRLYAQASGRMRRLVLDAFSSRVRTEEIKAWYSSPEDNSVFQGTSISSLTIPCRLKEPLRLTAITQLEETIAGSYIALHNKHSRQVKQAIVEDVRGWLKEGLYYGVVLSSKIISQAFGLAIGYEEGVFKVKNQIVDPHEITGYSPETRRLYFEACAKRLSCFSGLELSRQEMESSLVLADISKPRLKRYKQKIILGPVRCNEIAAILSERVSALIINKSNGRITPRGLSVVIYDTDTPYTYHQVMGYCKSGFFPVLPGLIVLGASGTIEAFRWLYAYRISLIAQKIMKSSLYSQVHGEFVPFVFFGVLVPRDAEILLDMNNLHRLRYQGNVNPEIEFAYLLDEYMSRAPEYGSMPQWKDLKTAGNFNNKRQPCAQSGSIANSK